MSAASSAVAERETVLTARGLSVTFPSPAGRIHAVDGVDLDLHAGETLALVGESGCGKSTLARALIGLVRPTAGKIRLGSREILAADRASLRPLRREIQLVFQDPQASLNPRLTVLSTLSEPLLLHGHADRKSVDAKVCELLEQVGLDPALRTRFPHEFSGGQQQRISIARSLAVHPKILLCDEVTSALDVSVQAQILELLRSLQKRFGLSYLFITHDLGVVRSIAQRVAVMYVGQIVELADTETLFESPSHPYTESLLASVPSVRRERAMQSVLKGEVPSPANPPSGCRFHPRCPRAFSRCSGESPSLYAVNSGESRCFLRDPAQAEPAGASHSDAPGAG
jgi:oligopeptide/dipeptide ABC transporter ATP-binding protein